MAGSLAYFYINRNSRKIRGINNVIKIKTHWKTIKNVTFDINGDNNLIFIKHGAQLMDTKIYMIGSNHQLIIGENCYITGGSFWFEDFGCKITIGKKTSIQEAHIYVTEPGSSIILGEDCLLSSDIDIRSGDSHSIIALNSKKRINFAEDVRIKDHVWIGAHVRIIKGVTIGNDSIIGTGAVVSHDIPSNCVAAGIPAKVIRKGITWLRPRLYRKDVQSAKIESYWAWYDQGDALRRFGNDLEAVICFDRSIALKPNYFRSFYARGLSLACLKKYEEAISSYDKSIDIRDDIAWVWYDRGLALVALGRFQEAVTSFGQALEIDPDYPSALYHQASALAQLGLYKQAINRYAQLLEITEDSGEGWYCMALCFAALKKVDESIESLQNAIDLNPELFRVRASKDNGFFFLRNHNRFKAILSEARQV